MQPLAFPWPSTLRNTTCLPSRRWLQSSKPEDPEAFDGSPDDPQPLFPTCLPGACPMLNNEQQTFFYDFHNMVLEVILRKGPGPNACAQEPLPLQFKSAFCPVEPCVVVAYTTPAKNPSRLPWSIWSLFLLRTLAATFCLYWLWQQVLRGIFRSRTMLNFWLPLRAEQ